MKPILFDCTIFIQHFFASNSGRSGVFFVAWNVLLQMQKLQMPITLAYTSEYENSEKLRNLKKYPFFSQFEFICVGIGLIENTLKLNIEKYKKNKNYLKMFYNYLKLLKKYAKVKPNSYYENLLKNYEIYFSPFYAIPKQVLNQKHIKKAYMLYDAIPLLPQNFFKDNYEVGRLYSQMLETLDKDTYCFCISKSCRDDFLKYKGESLNPNKMFVTYISTNQNYVPNYNLQELAKVLKKYKVEHNENDNYLFSLCTLEPRKNLPFTILCFLKFIKKHNIQNLYFYLGGSAWKSFENTMAKILEEFSDFGDKIKLLGYVDDSNTNILYSNSMFFTYLSQYEGFGMPPLEAMQAGVPVITSNNSSLPEVVGDAAISLTYNDEHQIIKAFEDFYFNENLRKEYIARGLERAKMFSWEKCVEKIIEVMKNV